MPGYIAAVRWFAVGYLLSQAGKTSWEQADARDIQQWTVQLLDRYSSAYASIQFRALRQFFKWRAAEEQCPDPDDPAGGAEGHRDGGPGFPSGELSELARACQGLSDRWCDCWWRTRAGWLREAGPACRIDNCPPAVVECGLCLLRRMCPHLMRWRGCVRGSWSWRDSTRGCARRPRPAMSWPPRSWPRGTRRSRRWPRRSRNCGGAWTRTPPRRPGRRHRTARIRRSRGTGRCAAGPGAGRASSPARSPRRCGSHPVPARRCCAGRPRAAAAGMT